MTVFGCRRPTHVLADEGGAAILEFALILPIIFALLAGCYEIGQALLVRQSMLEGVRGGARALARLPDPRCQPACPKRAEDVLALTRATIAQDARIRPETIRLSSGWDARTQLVAVTAEVHLHGDLLGAVGLSPLLTLSATHREAWLAE